MNGKPAITWFKYQVFLYGSEAITYLKLYFEWLQSQQYESSHCRPPPTTGSPSPTLYGSITFTDLKETSCMVKLPYLF